MYPVKIFALFFVTFRLPFAHSIDWLVVENGPRATSFERLSSPSGGELRRGGDSAEVAMTAVSELYKRFVDKLAADRRSGPVGHAVKSGRSADVATGGGATGRTTASTAEPAERPTAFVDERECSDANGGRPCVCRTVDLLERLLADGRTAVGCPSYSVVPAEVVFDSPASTADVGGTAVYGSGPRDGDVVAVDFNAVIDYRPAPPSDNGKRYREDRGK